MRNSIDDLDRFILAQESIYDDVLFELRNGHKTSHWMWFIFPQIEGLGTSKTAQYYAIKTKNEAEQYLTHPILGKRLLECTDIVFHIHGRAASEIFGFPDDLKFKSSMTLFAAMSKPESMFEKNIRKYFNADFDNKTLKILENY